MGTNYEILNDKFGSSCVYKQEEPLALECFYDREDAVEFKRELETKKGHEGKGGL